MQTKSAPSATSSVQNTLNPKKFGTDRHRRSPIRSNDRTGFDRAVACLDNTPNGSIVYRHTKAIADGLQIPLNIIHVMQGASPQIGPSDPISWQLQRRQAREHLHHLLDGEHDVIRVQDPLLLNGLVGDELLRWAREHSGSLMAVSTRCKSPHQKTGRKSAEHSLGSTAQKLLESSAASMLFIPPEAGQTGTVIYKRLVVPLDGSCRAESILPVAIRIARQNGAELVLAHVVPKPEIVESSAYDEEALEIVSRIQQHNEQNARIYLNRLKARLHGESVVIKTVVNADGDPRDRLLRIADEQQADLIVMSARGRSGMMNIPCGTIVRHVATHSSIPLLMIRQQTKDLRDPVELSDEHRGPRLFWESAH